MLTATLNFQAYRKKIHSVKVIKMNQSEIKLLIISIILFGLGLMWLSNILGRLGL